MNSSYSQALSGLALALKNENETITLPDGKAVNCKNLLCMAATLDPKNYIALTQLGHRMNAGESFTLPDGREMDNKALFMESWNLSPLYSSAYVGLAKLQMYQHQKIILQPINETEPKVNNTLNTRKSFNILKKFMEKRMFI